ncbi:MAG TPA: hypothetical protein DSN98_07175 [Thermoplasmata archaeon]|nr:MAG TPA: hypothetical protein DSN98_07175 [Thermoplasmata archaeon]
MDKKIVAIGIVFLLAAVYIPTTRTTPVYQAITPEKLLLDTTTVTIYVNTTAIDKRNDLNNSQKSALKNRILQHIRNNYNDAVGAGNVTVTDNPAQASSANRSVQIEPGMDPNPEPAWGRWPAGSNKTKVFLGEFMNDSSVNGSFKNPDGTWNTTKLGNAIGHTSGHEVGHSYSIGHNHKTGPKNGADNRSKMTAGGLINESARASANFTFDNHSKDVLRDNWGKPPCVAVADYDLKVIASNFWGEPSNLCKTDEGGTLDVMFIPFTDMPGFFEFGFLGTDTDHGLVDGNPEFDFIYKSSLTMNMDLDAEILSFIGGNHDHTQWLLRGSEISPFPGQWFPLDPAMITLMNPIENPDGKTVYRLVTMMWPEQGVHIAFDALSYGADSNPFNGFTYDYAPTPPTITGPTTGEPGTSYDFAFQSTYTLGFDLLYKIDWGDGTPSEWIGPFPQGMIVYVPHIWQEAGTYSIAVKTKPIAEGTESVWSTAEIAIASPPPQLTVTITGGLGVNVKIKNIGETDITSLPWSISLDGGFILAGQDTSGSVDLAVGEEKTVHAFVLGFGRPTITATAGAFEETATGFVLFVFVVGVQQ